MGFIVWIILGALAGWIASKIMGTDAQMGAGANIIVGIIGSMLGGWIVRMVMPNAATPNGLDLWSILVSVLGAVVLLFILSLFNKRR